MHVTSMQSEWLLKPVVYEIEGLVMSEELTSLQLPLNGYMYTSKTLSATYS